MRWFAGIYNKNGISLKVLVGIVLVVVIVVGLYAYYNYKISEGKAPKQIISNITTETTSQIKNATILNNLQPLLPQSYSIQVNEPLQVNIPIFSQGDIASVYEGNGKIIKINNNTFNVSYEYPGQYLLYYNLYNNNSLIGSSSENLIQIIVFPYFNFSQSSLLTIPVMSLNKGSIISLGEQFNISIGFLQPPSGQNMTIYEYVLSLGNGTTLTIPALNSTGYAEQVALTGSGNISYIEPSKNPITLSFNEPGLYAISLTIITKNVSSGKTYNYTTYQSVAVSSENMKFSLYSSQSTISNPGIIVDAEVVPGGPFTFDPLLWIDTISQEVINNIYGSLIWYYQSSTTKFIPMLAEYIPTVGNWSNTTARYLYGAISPNYTIYIFKIRPGLKASNGDPITAYDVWYTMIRALVCAGGFPGAEGTYLAPFTIPNYNFSTFIIASPTDSLGAKEIINSVSYDNQTNTVTFHLVQPVNPTFFFNIMTSFDYVMDAKWLESVGDGLNLTGLYNNNFTQLAEAFYQYQQTCNAGNYNTQVQWPSSNAGFTGLYYIASFTPGESVVLKPNPYWLNNITYFPKPNNTIIIDWVQDPTTALNMLASGEADIVTFPKIEISPYLPKLEQLQSQGKAKIYGFSSLNIWYYDFNLNISVPLLKQINPSYNIPSYYFANPLVRKAFAYAFNYSEYINDILGNSKYHMNFGQPWCGVLLPGVDYSVPPSELSNCPTFNLTYAKQLMEESGFYNISVYFPIIVSSGDTVDFTAAEMWAQALHEMDPNINAQPLYMPWSTILSYDIPAVNPMPIYYIDWNGLPISWDWLPFNYQEGSINAAPNAWNISFLTSLSLEFNSTNNTYVGALIWQEAQQFKQLVNLINEADNADVEGWSNASVIIKEAQQQAINLYTMVYVVIPNKFLILAPYMKPYQNNIGWESNPAYTNGLEQEFWWWTK
ncbi:extracellular solute-binding protein, family 5 [Caldisphaera lagunensis DSM 15908]|uniref:Extracellular solute-binding protein, family 5 n=1 Tax=Caldisphaera lagunensis (strain DSM 15908 / JCM 11604 / ANMR 0165 / IC-154) TaxID=1056495 RepID=L0ABE7_CALLD|nr:ABC transporter substrate-binding protein [Caldisphaera lagunensis]AFZ70375.1 extracellular solute-binding protein, family 5 [Caldisphaera lagunensis DSM 15908]